MTHFETQLDVRKQPKPKIWQLLSPLVAISGEFKLCVTAPEGFETDFASIPALPVIGAVVLLLVSLVLYYVAFLPWLVALWWFALYVIVFGYYLATDDLLDAPAAIHDYGYATQTLPRWVFDCVLFLLYIHNHGKCSRLKTFWVYYKAVHVFLNVRLFGLAAWKSDQVKYGLIKN